MEKPIQIVLASSSKLFLEGIQKILEDEGSIKIVAKISNPEEVEKCLCEIKPKFLFLDNRTLNLDIHKLSNLITKKSPDTKVILFSDYIKNGFTFPNAIYVTKEVSSLELIDIIKGLDKGVVTKETTGVESARHELTKMEMKIIELIADCLSNKEIAKKLSISEKTVKAHLTNIFTKLGFQSRYQLIVYARQLKRKDN
jgi:DNA-binding NarL/FixJ family response regulator